MFNGKAVLIFLCIFLAGGVAGHFTGLRMACAQGKKNTEPTAQAQTPPRRPVEEWSSRFQKDFNTRIGTTPEQQALLEPVIRASQTEFRQLRERFGQHAADVTERLDAEVMTLLSDEQKPKYELMMKERQERFRKKEAERAAAAARGEPPPGPPPHRGERPPMPPTGEKPAVPAGADQVSPPPPPVSVPAAPAAPAKAP